MKRFGNLYPKVYDMENIRLAHQNARKGKAHYKEVQQIDAEPEKYFLMIQNMLKNKTFKNSKYVVFKKMDKGKEREIYKLPYFPDRIIHHCIMQVVESIWTKTLITDTYACIKGRGLHKCVRKIQKLLIKNKNLKYCLKIDISKFYPSVDHDILKNIIKKKIKDKDLLLLLNNIIDSAKGIPIGNYLSQHFGNLYLSNIDHYIKEVLKCKNYFRYSDDMVILDKDKNYLFKILSIIRHKIYRNLLIIKNNYQVFPINKRGVDFLGYRIFFYYTLLRKRISKSILKAIQSKKGIKLFNSFMSYNGWTNLANCYNFLTVVIRKIGNILNKFCNSKNKILWRFKNVLYIH